MQELGMSLANFSKTGIFTAHLYNALKVNDPSLPEWKEMDEMIAIHTPEKVFQGEAPQDLNGF